MTTSHSLTSVRVKRHSTREEHASLGDRKLEHTSVMTKEALELLNLKKDEVVFDATAGGGGHSEAMLRAAHINLFALDADEAAVERTRKRLAPLSHGKGARTEVLAGNFRDIESILQAQGLTHIDKILFDLGWSSYQLGERGFSFQQDQELNMSYGATPTSGFTAKEIVNTWDEETIANALYGYGEERYSRKIAAAIVERRAIHPLTTTLELVELIKDAVPPAYRHGKIHPATRTFQALRMAVNDELGSIDKGMRAAWKHLSPGGRMVVITFHSIEDRAVKRLFLELAKEDGTILTKKPLAATQAEIKANPRARSAKVRAIEKSH